MHTAASWTGVAPIAAASTAAASTGRSRRQRYASSAARRYTALAASFDDAADAQALARSLQQRFADQVPGVAWAAPGNDEHRLALRLAVASAQALRTGHLATKTWGLCVGALGVFAVTVLLPGALPMAVGAVALAIGMATAALGSFAQPRWTHRQSSSWRWLEQQLDRGRAVVFVPGVPPSHAADLAQMVGDLAPRWWGISRRR